MIIKYFDLKKNLKKNINFYLLYGPNVGFIEETINNTFKPILSKNVFNYDESEILVNISGFKESIFNKSFFDNDKLIIINRGSDKILSVLEDIINERVSETTLIIKSNILEKKSKLRSFFEKNKDIIIVPFYEDNHQSLMSIAQNFFRERKIKISPQNINYIVERSKGNRINLKNELEKIENFSKKKLSVELNEILKLTNLADNYNVSELTDQCLALNKKKTLNILNENNPSSEDNILIIKTFLYKLKRLKKLKIELENKKNSDVVISSFRPPIFWKDKDIIKQQLKIWSISQIKSLINKTNSIELLIKKNSQLSSQIVNDFIMERLEVSNN
jgi:DNA polymerase III subunit delta